MRNKQVYAVIVGYDCPQGQICDEILGADSKEAAQDAAEHHWQKWLKALPGKRKLRWTANFAQESYLNIPYYRMYSSEVFEWLKCNYPHHAEFLNNLWKPSAEDRAKQLLEMNSGVRDEDIFSESMGRFTYAEKELKKLGYVYSYRERRWYPPTGISV